MSDNAVNTMDDILQKNNIKKNKLKNLKNRGIDMADALKYAKEIDEEEKGKEGNEKKED